MRHGVWLSRLRVRLLLLVFIAALPALAFVEQVTGRLGHGGAVAQGASSGAPVGAVLGFILGLLGLVSPIVSSLGFALWGIITGAIVGGLIGLLWHALAGGGRTFSSAVGLQAGRNDVIAEAAAATEARHVLSRLPREPTA